MKKLFILSLSFLLIAVLGVAQNPKDTSAKKMKTIEKRIVVSVNDDGSEHTYMDNNEGPLPDQFVSENKCGDRCSKKMQFCRERHKMMNKPDMPRPMHLSIFKKLFVLMPVILFILSFLMIYFWLRRENFRLSDVLSSKTAHINKTNRTYPDPNDSSKILTETTEDVCYPRSASKLLAFITGITGIIIAICMISFHAYFMISGRPMNVHEHHSCGIFAIGFILLVGMLPYIFRSFRK
jgi:hypothetical protein